MLTQEELKRQLHYDPETGEFTWLVKKPGRSSGKLAGKTRRNGYKLICVNYKEYYSHRLAWLYVYGVWPTESVDHVNRDPSDNRICNLREVTHANNLRNVGARKNSTTGVKGVTLQKGGKYRASICVDSKKQHIGLYWTIEEAAAAYEAEARRLYGEFAYPA